jgi:hypothetical protein
MSGKNILSLHTLPVELVYRVLDNLNTLDILYSMRNVSKRINAITDSYYEYQVSVSSIIFRYHYIISTRHLQN